MRKIKMRKKFWAKSIDLNFKLKQMKKIYLFLFLSIYSANIVQSQAYNIVIKDGKIILVEKNIDAKQAKQVVNAKGLYVTPGLIDIHTHSFAGTNLDQAYM